MLYNAISPVVFSTKSLVNLNCSLMLYREGFLMVATEEVLNSASRLV